MLHTFISFLSYLTDTIVAKSFPQKVLSSFYQENIEGKCLNSSRSLINTEEKSESKCAVLCNKNSNCLSFGIRIVFGGKICQLYSQDIYSRARGVKILQKDTECKYFGMKKERKPMCQQDGVFADIQNDGKTSENCAMIRRKRVDREWGKWGWNETLDDGVDRKTIQRRQILIDAAHGGIEGNGSSEKIVRWIKFVKHEMTWDKANESCELLGGELFHRVNGTQQQLDFFVDKMGNKSHWLGIYTDDHVVWKSVLNDVIKPELLLWKRGQPNNNGGDQNHVANTAPWNNVPTIGLSDNNKSEKKRFICDII